MSLLKDLRAITAIAPLMAAVFAASAHAETRAYDWLTIGEPSGELIVETAADGARSLTFSFNDRGRGPELTADYRLDEAGVPISIRITGLNYRKGDVDETFAIEDGVARWQTASASGEQRLAEPALYNLGAATGIPEHAAILARALLNDADRSMPMLPTGVLSIREIETADFPGPDGAVTATLYALYDGSPFPNYIWLDENKDLFGADYRWFALAPKGMASAMPVMKEKQDAATNARVTELSDELRSDASGLVVIRGAKLFDSLTGDVVPRSTVFLQDGVIAAVYDRRIDAPAGAKVIDAKGKMLLPALWDMHAHVGTTNLFNYLAAGVVNIRDMANDPEYIISLKRDLTEGRIAGPDLHAMGFIDKKSEFAAPTGNLAQTLKEALAFVDWYAQQGFLGIKLYSSIEPEWVAPIAESARARNLSVLGHIPSYMTAEQAVRGGYNEITHINMFFLNFMNAEEIDTRTPQRFIVPIREGGKLDLESKAVEDFIDLMVERDIALDPTYTIFRSMFVNTPGEVETEAVHFYDHLPETEQPGWLSEKGFNAGLEEEGAATAQVAGDLLVKLHERGVRLLPGTDAGYPGFVLLRELDLYAQAGIPENEVLQLATIEPARHMGLDQSLGSVTPGKRAHLILVSGDPTKRMTDLYKVDLVIKDTAMFKPADIHRTFDIKPFH